MNSFARIALVVTAAAATVALPLPAHAATLTVTTTADDNTINLNCTLREAILAANADDPVDLCATGSGTDTIAFNILGTGQHTINVGPSALPSLTAPVTIDGTTDPDDDGRIEIDGTATTDASGLTIDSSTVTIKGLVINDFGVAGIAVQSGTDSFIQNSHLGTTPAGLTADANQNGIRVSGGSVTIGGAGAGEGNVISGNSFDGIDINAGAGPLTIQGNTIGLGADGATDVGNGSRGIDILNSGSHLIGTNAAGVGAGNVISGNGSSGVGLFGSDGTAVRGNLIGTDATGGLDRGNTDSGIDVGTQLNLTIGGDTAAERNVISGNGNRGIALNGGSSSFNNVIIGNYIGTDDTGLLDLGNDSNGIEVNLNVIGLNIGGTAAGEGNVISGNGGDGIRFVSGQDHLVQGNLIGLGVDGSTVVANGGHGVSNWATGGLQLGSIGAGRNVISGNVGDGVNLSDLTGSQTLVGNYIGTDATGFLDRGNGGDGVDIHDRPSNTVGPGNVISGNGGNGVRISGDGASSNVVKGNLIGVASDGDTALGNTLDGVLVSNPDTNEDTNDNVIGGTGPAAGNVISGNGGDGVDLTGRSVSGTVIEGNSIGTNDAGVLDVGNAEDGVQLSDLVDNTTIGGTTAAARNIISGNSSVGIFVNGFGANTVITGNYVGMQANGTTVLPNGDNGMFVNDPSARIGGTTGVTPGGSCTGACNLISGNGSHGLSVGGTTPLIQGNYIGTDVTGLLDRGNASFGIRVGSGTGVTIGGDTPQERNVVSGNANGIGFEDIGAINGLVSGNYVGVGTDGTTALGNSGAGVRFGADGSTLGGTTAAEANVIRNNTGAGVMVNPDAQNIALLRNDIFENGGLGIDLDGNSAVNPNDADDADFGGGNDGQNFPDLTGAFTDGTESYVTGSLDTLPSTSFEVDLYASPTCNASDPNDHGEGASWLSSSSEATDANGVVTFAGLEPAVSVGQVLAATARAPGGNTSEFSECEPVVSDVTAPPDPGLSAVPPEAVWTNDNTITASWTQAPDGGSGVNGYSVEWNVSQLDEADATLDLQQTASSTTSPALADGAAHWFHIKVLDNLGNVSGDVALGPFMVDTEDPPDPAPTATPPENAWTGDNTIDVSWTQAPDGASGVDGYSFEWNASQAAPADQSKDVEETANQTTSPPLADGSSHWFHIRTLDGAGNWGSDVALGPFMVDTGVPGVPTLTAPSGPFAMSPDIQVAWQGGDPPGGQGSVTFDVRYRSAGPAGGFGAPVAWQNDVTSTTAMLPGTPGTTYCFSVVATDGVNNVSPASAEACTSVPLDDADMGHKKGFKQKSGPGHYLDTFSRAKSKGAFLSADVTTNHVALLIDGCAKCGSVKVSLGSTLLGKVSLKGPSGTQIITVADLPAPVTETLTITSTKDKKVQIEGVGLSAV